jgi:hypothetical protein
MKIKETVLREKISRILREARFGLSLGVGHQEVIDIPEIDGSPREVIDVSSISSFNAERLSLIVDAITEVGQENVNAWDIVAEQMLQHFGFSKPFGKRYKFFDVTSGDGTVAYSVKSSFGSTKIERSMQVVNKTQLDLGTLFKIKKVDGTAVVELVRNGPAENASMAGSILCYRKNISEKKFEIVWDVYGPVSFDELKRNIIKTNFSDREDPKVLKALRAGDAPEEIKNLPPSIGVQLTPFADIVKRPDSSEDSLEEKFRRVNQPEFTSLFGSTFSDRYVMRFSNYTEGQTDTYMRKAKLISKISAASDDEIEAVEKVFSSLADKL